MAQVWAAGLLLMAAIFWLTTEEDPVTSARRAQGVKPDSLRQQFARVDHIEQLPERQSLEGDRISLLHTYRVTGILSEDFA